MPDSPLKHQQVLHQATAEQTSPYENVEQGGELHLTCILERVTDAFLTFDRQWRVTSINHQPEPGLQGIREILLGKLLWDIFPEAVASSFYWRYHQAIETHHPFHCEEFYPPLSKWFEIHVYPSNESIAVFFQDITRRKQAEEELFKLAAIVESSDDAIFSKTLDGMIISWNKGAERLYGYSAEEMLGRLVHTLVPLERMQELQEIMHLERAGQRVDHFETTRIRKDGRLIQVSITISPVKDARGTLIGASTIARDITERKQIEEKLSESEKRFRALIEQSADAIILVDSHGIILYASPSTQRLLGYDPEELRGHNAFELIHPDDLEYMLQVLSIVLEQGKALCVEYRARHKDGSWRWMEANGTNLLDEPGVGAIVGNYRDITEHKRVEERQRLLNEVSEKLVSSLNHHITLQEIAQMLVPSLADYCRIALLDEKQRIKDITAHHIDPEKIALVRALYEQYKDRASSTHGIQKILETGKAELISFVTPEVLAPFVQEKAELLSLVQTLGLQSYMGTPLIAHQRIIGAITFSSIQPHRHYTQEDLLFAQELARRIALILENAHLYQQAQEEIAERKQLEEQLQRSKEQLEAMLKTIADGIVLQDATGKIIYANQAAAILSGYRSVEELLQAPALAYLERFELTDEQGHPFPMASFPGRRVIGGEGHVLVTVRARKKESEEVRWLMISSTAVVDRDGRPWAAMSVLHDITQFKELEHRKDDFLSMASHELKTPLTSVRLYTQLLQMKIGEMGRNEVLLSLSKMNTQINKLIKLVTDLLDIPRAQAGKVVFAEETFDFDELVREVVETLQQTTPQHHIIIEGAAKYTFVGDRDRLGQVVINLISNAIKYSPHAEKVLIRFSQTPHQLTVSVQDFGLGIPTHHQKHIFERFYRVHIDKEKTYPGLGIGLYIAHQIIEYYGGKMWVESVEGQGSTFSFSLPLTEKDGK